MEIAATFVIALDGWGWAIFQHLASRKREEPDRELAVDKRVAPYTGGTPDFPSASFSFCVDDVSADCARLSIIIKIAPALDSTTFASFKRTWSIHKPNR